MASLPLSAPKNRDYSCSLTPGSRGLLPNTAEDVFHSPHGTCLLATRPLLANFEAVLPRYGEASRSKQVRYKRLPR